MPPTLDNDSQFRFLISCIRHSNGGKVDFEEVRKECEIVSKGAAAKRYERLMKAHGIVLGGASSPAKKDAGNDTPKKSKANSNANANKKRKLDRVNDEESDIDDEVKSETIIKGEVKTEVKNEGATVKSELSSENNPSTLPLYRPSSQSTPHPTSSSTFAPIDDDDDDIVFVSASEKPIVPSPSPNPQHHFDEHRPSHAPSPATNPSGVAVHAPDYAANTSFSQPMLATTCPLLPRAAQLAAPAARRTVPSDPLPYGFNPIPWYTPHDHPGYQ
ncbi:hypothetical protein F4808DRAFT_458748 [Astrocystis sublimbata]|nr:hypothetical protein F4808DRAFT_458748 [Astrocystis sublimbata]